MHNMSEERLAEGIGEEEVPRSKCLGKQMDLQCSPQEDPNPTGQGKNISIQPWN